MMKSEIGDKTREEINCMVMRDPIVCFSRSKIKDKRSVDKREKFYEI